VIENTIRFRYTDQPVNTFRELITVYVYVVIIVKDT